MRWRAFLLLLIVLTASSFAFGYVIGKITNKKWSEKDILDELKAREYRRSLYFVSIGCGEKNCTIKAKENIYISKNVGISMFPGIQFNSYSFCLNVSGISNEEKAKIIGIGDVVAFRNGKGKIPTSHRVIAYCNGGVVTKGDFNPVDDGCIPFEDIICIDIGEIWG